MEDIKQEQENMHTKAWTYLLNKFVYDKEKNKFCNIDELKEIRKIWNKSPISNENSEKEVEKFEKNKIALMD